MASLVLNTGKEVPFHTFSMGSQEREPSVLSSVCGTGMDGEGHGGLGYGPLGVLKEEGSSFPEVLPHL